MASAFEGNAGNILSEILGGVVFLLVGIHLQGTTENKIDLLYERLKRDQDKENYQRMIDFLESGDTYDFFTPDINTANGSYYVYSLKGILGPDGKPIFYNHEFFPQHIISVYDIAHRSVLKEEDLNEYIYGPLRVGEAYYVRHSASGWYVEDSMGKHIRIQWFGKNGGVFSRPTANQLVKPSLGVSLNDLKPFSSFLYSPDGEESNQGNFCELYVTPEGNNYLVLSRDGTPRRVIATTATDDFTGEELYLKIEKVEGFFSSKLALDNFKNLVNEKCQENGVKIKEVSFYEVPDFKGV